MKHNTPNDHRILAIALGTRGFGFAVLEGEDALVEWAVKSVSGDKNARALKKAEALLAYYWPGVVVLEDCDSSDSRRAPRIRELSRQIIAVAEKLKVKVVRFSQKQVRRAFFADRKGTKHEIAEVVAKVFPQELELRLPPKRQPWMSEDYRMGIFDAVALALTLRLWRKRRARKTPAAGSQADQAIPGQAG